MTRSDHPIESGSILFTDLVGFTEYNGIVGDLAAVQMLDQQRQVVDEHLRDRNDTRVVKELGDGLMIWFAAAESGLRRTIALLESFDRIRRSGRFPLSIRMGLHHGESIARGSDLVGQTVNIAARISAIAGPGELLVSDEVVAAAGADLAIRLRPVGPVTVKGVNEPVWLHRVLATER